MYAGPEGPQNFKSGLNGKSPNVVDNRNDCTIYETKSFEMPDLPEPVDVTKRQRAIGEFFLMQDEESSMDRHMRAATERCMSAQRSIAIYDEDVDTFVEVRLIDAFEHDALIQNDGFTAVGDECEGYGDDPNDKYEGDTSFGDLPHNEKNKNHMPPLEDGTIERFASTYFDGITENDLIVKMHANVPSYLKQMDYVTDMGSILNVSSMTEIFKDSSSVDSAITTHTDAYAAWLYAHTIAEHSVRAYACDELFFRYTESVKRYDECMPLPPCLSDKIGVEQTILAVLIAIRQNNPIYYSTKYESDSIKNIYKEFHDKDDGGSFDGTGMYLTGYKITKRIYESMSIVGADSKYTSRTMKVNPIGYNNYAGVKLLSKCDGHECYQPNECKALIEAFDTLCDGMDVCFEFTKDVKQSLFGLCILKCTYAGNLTVNTKNPESNEDNSAYALTRHAINDFNSGEDMRLRIFAQSQSTENGNTSMNVPANDTDNVLRELMTDPDLKFAYCKHRSDVCIETSDESEYFNPQVHKFICGEVQILPPETRNYIKKSYKLKTSDLTDENIRDLLHLPFLISVLNSKSYNSIEEEEHMAQFKHLLIAAYKISLYMPIADLHHLRQLVHEIPLKSNSHWYDGEIDISAVLKPSIAAHDFLKMFVNMCCCGYYVKKITPNTAASTLRSRIRTITEQIQSLLNRSVGEYNLYVHTCEGDELCFVISDKGFTKIKPRQGLIISPFKAPSSFKNVIIGLTAPENGFFARIKNTHFDTEKRGVLFGWLKANKDRIKNCNTLDVEHDTLALIYHHAHNPSSSSASHTFLGMPSVQINAMPTGTEQFWVTRAFLRRFNDSVHSKRPHEYFIYTLMCMQKTGPKFLRKVINENKLFPFGYLLLRPYQTYETCTAILMKGGAETGETLIGYYNFQLADNVVQKMHYGNFTIYEKSVVYRSRNVLLQPDIMVTNYLGGGGSKFYNDKRREDAVTFSTAVPSLYACLIGYNEQIKDNPLDVTGKFASHTGLQNIKETMYSTAGYYKDKYQFEHANAPSSDEPYFEQPVQKNTLCFQGHQARYNYQTGGLDRVTLNTGHWGERVYPGCGKVRKGLSKYLEPVTYSHMYHGGGMMMGSM
eukprot:gene224-400_t